MFLMSGDLTGLCLYILSLSSIHILRIESFFLPYELKIESVSLSSVLARLWSFAGVPSFGVSFPIRSNIFRVGGEIRSCALPKNVQKSYILPQDHGALAQWELWQKDNQIILAPVSRGSFINNVKGKQLSDTRHRCDRGREGVHFWSNLHDVIYGRSLRQLAPP